MATAAATGSVAIEPLLLFLIIFLWTPPHFWALSLVRADDYARARVPMLPVVAGAKETRRQILLYTAVLALVGASPWLLGYSGMLYGIVAVVAGGAMLIAAWRVWAERDGARARQAALRLFSLSIAYLFVVFAAMLAVDIAGRGT